MSRTTLSILGIALALPASGRAADLSRFLPAETEYVVTIHVDALLKAPLLKKHLPGLLHKHGGDALALLLQAMHFDKKKIEVLGKITSFANADAAGKFLQRVGDTVQRIQLAGSEGDDEQFFLVVEGKFTADQVKGWLEAAAKEKALGFSFRVLKAGKREFYAVRSDEEEVYLALVEDRTLLVSPNRTDVEKALERVEKKDGVVRKSLTDEAARVDAKAVVWLAGSVAEPEDLAAVRATLRISDGVKGVLTLTATDADKAESAANDLKVVLDVLREGLNEMAKSNKLLAALVDVLKKVEPSRAEAVVELKLDVPAAVLEKLLTPKP